MDFSHATVVVVCVCVCGMDYTIFNVYMCVCDLFAHGEGAGA